MISCRTSFSQKTSIRIKPCKTYMSFATDAWLNPALVSKWWIWIFPGVNGDSPFHILIVKTLTASKTGINTIPSTNTGALVKAGLIAFILAWINRIPKTAMIKPNTSEPVSPIKILAGLKLKYKNASIAPARAKAINEPLLSPLIIRKAPNTTRLMKPNPPARPSMPSIRLNALVIPTMAIIVKVYCESKGNSPIPKIPLNDVILTPDNAISVARPIWIKNLYRAERSLRSSIIPTAKRITIERRKQIWNMSLLKGYQKNNAEVIPAMIAIPPIVGIGSKWIFLSFGAS